MSRHLLQPLLLLVLALVAQTVSFSSLSTYAGPFVQDLLGLSSLNSAGG